MKDTLKQHIAEGNPQLTFEALKEKGADISDIETRYNEREAFEQNLRAEKKQYTTEQYHLSIGQFDTDNAALLSLIDELF